MIVNRKLYKQIQQMVKEHTTEPVYKITVKADAKVLVERNGEDYQEVTDEKDLKSLDGITEHGTEFADYFHNGTYDGFVKGGQMSFHFAKGKLEVHTVYTSIVKLDKVQLEHLMEYTQGQWSDGVGEGFEQNPAAELDGQDVFISAYHDKQKIVIRQSKM